MNGLRTFSAGLALLFLTACQPQSVTDEAPIGTEEHVVPNNAAEAVDPAPIREVVTDYFEALQSGRSKEAAAFWCELSGAAVFSDRVAGLGAFRVNIANPLPARPSPVAWTVSLQLLDPANANLLDGTAWISPLPPGRNRRWCIEEIGLQPPPVPL